MDLHLRLEDGAGPVRLGMTREQVRAALGGPFSVFRRGAETSESDHFEPLGVIAGYDAQGRCRTIEMFGPARPLLEGLELVGLPYSEVRRRILAYGKPIDEDGASLTVDELGLGIYAPFASEAPEEPVQGVLVARRGYWSGPEE